MQHGTGMCLLKAECLRGFRRADVQRMTCPDRCFPLPDRLAHDGSGGAGGESSAAECLRSLDTDIDGIRSDGGAECTGSDLRAVQDAESEARP